MRKNAVFLTIGMFPYLVKEVVPVLKLIRIRTIRYNQHNQDTCFLFLLLLLLLLLFLFVCLFWGFVFLLLLSLLLFFGFLFCFLFLFSFFVV